MAASVFTYLDVEIAHASDAAEDVPVYAVVVQDAKRRVLSLCVNGTLLSRIGVVFCDRGELVPRMSRRL
jgi:hypothetical protein